MSGDISIVHLVLEAAITIVMGVVGFFVKSIDKNISTVEKNIDLLWESFNERVAKITSLEVEMATIRATALEAKSDITQLRDHIDQQFDRMIGEQREIKNESKAIKETLISLQIAFAGRRVSDRSSDHG